jgi:DDE superfamily endonuclease
MIPELLSHGAEAYGFRGEFWTCTRVATVIWEGSPSHKGHVRTFLAEGGARQAHVEQLPPYAPDLNPGEGVWNLLKNVERRNLCCLNLAHLRTELELAIKRLRRKPHAMTACFAQAGLSVET